MANGAFDKQSILTKGVYSTKSLKDRVNPCVSYLNPANPIIPRLYLPGLTVQTVGSTYLAGLYIAFTTSSTYYTSPDFYTWTTRTLPATFAGWYSMAGTLYMIPSSGNIYTTTDGINWTIGSLISSFVSATTRVLSNSIAILITPSTTQYQTTTDFVTFTTRNYPITIPASFNLYVFNDTWFINTAINGASMYYTTDGINWSTGISVNPLVTMPSILGYYNNNYWIFTNYAVDQNYGTPRIEIYSTTDFINLKLALGFSPPTDITVIGYNIYPLLLPLGILILVIIATSSTTSYIANGYYKYKLGDVNVVNRLTSGILSYLNGNQYSYSNNSSRSAPAEIYRLPNGIINIASYGYQLASNGNINIDGNMLETAMEL
jgi:hypothetical protein